jgi:hypothetical protein
MTDSQIKAATYGHIVGGMLAMNLVLGWWLVASLAARGGVWWAP